MKEEYIEIAIHNLKCIYNAKNEQLHRLKFSSLDRTQLPDEIAEEIISALINLDLIETETDNDTFYLTPEAYEHIDNNNIDTHLWLYCSEDEHDNYDPNKIYEIPEEDEETDIDHLQRIKKHERQEKVNKLKKIGSYLLLFILAASYSYCHKEILFPDSEKLETPPFSKDTRSIIDSIQQAYTAENEPYTFSPKQITGYFNSDNVLDTLTEFLVNSSYINIKYPEDTLLSYEDQITFTHSQSPISYLLSTNLKDTLHIGHYNIFGLFHLKNEGDINNDGYDEISYTIDYTDFSSLNTYHIVTYQHDKWIKLFSFPVWEWQIDEKSPKIVTKVEPKCISYIFRNEESELDTAYINF